MNICSEQPYGKEEPSSHQANARMQRFSQKFYYKDVKLQQQTRRMMKKCKQKGRTHKKCKLKCKGQATEQTVIPRWQVMAAAGIQQLMYPIHISPLFAKQLHDTLLQLSPALFIRIWSAQLEFVVMHARTSVSVLRTQQRFHYCSCQRQAVLYNLTNIKCMFAEN